MLDTITHLKVPVGQEERSVCLGPDGSVAHVTRVLKMISGRWKLEILWLLNQRTHRFGELKRGLPGITQHMLTAQLRALEKDGLIKRTIFAEVPPRVEYEITPNARRLRPIFVEIVKWAQDNEKGVTELQVVKSA